MTLSAAAVEVVRGDLGEDRAAEVLEFWSKRGLQGEEAAARLPDVVCVAIDEDGEVVGVNTATDRTLRLLGRRLWLYESKLSEQSDELAAAMFNSAFEALAEESGGDDEQPIGVYVVVGDRALMERRPEAVWPETELMFAGYRPDGSQVRVRYFWGATVGPADPSAKNMEQAAARDYRMDERFEIEPLAGSKRVSVDDVLSLWAKEGVVADAAARRRIDQVELVAIAGDGEIAGVSSIYLDRSPRLQMDMWHYRTFVASGYRHSSLAAQLLFHNQERLEARFASGEDRRAPGMIFELQNEGLMRTLNTAVWPRSGFTFIGDTPHGTHVRVRYFEGAQVSLPDAPGDS
jgi:hypothetical protein